MKRFLKNILSTIDCDNIIVLQPTSPLRDYNTIDECINEYINGEYRPLLFSLDKIYQNTHAKIEFKVV